MARPRKSRVWARGQTLWVTYYVDGKRIRQSTGLKVGQERKARELLRKLEARAKAKDAFGEGGPLTVKRYFERWIKAREQEGLRAVRDDEARMRKHVLPVIGSIELAQVTRKDVRDLVKGLKRGTLANRTVRNVYGVMHKMFADAVTEDLIDLTPCVLGKRDLPKIADKDPAWRSQAVFTRAELEQILSSDEIPEDRRVFYALLFLAGLRVGEAIALRWGDWNREREPLGHLLVCKSYYTKHQKLYTTKTDVPREVPVHEALVSFLSWWRDIGWPRAFGRPPEDDDLLIPNTYTAGKGRRVWGVDVYRRNDHVRKKLLDDIKMLGLRKRRTHDTRRTFISLARADGAREDILKWVTHGRPGGIVNIYSELPWDLLCEQVKCLRVNVTPPSPPEPPTTAQPVADTRESGLLTHWHSDRPRASLPVLQANETEAGNTVKSGCFVSASPLASTSVQVPVTTSIPAGSIVFSQSEQPLADECVSKCVRTEVVELVRRALAEDVKDDFAAVRETLRTMRRVLNIS